MLWGSGVVLIYFLMKHKKPNKLADDSHADNNKVIKGSKNLPRNSRLNPSYKYAVYSYDCWILNQIPESFWQHVKLQNELWNKLVSYVHECTDEYYKLTKEDRLALPKEDRKKVFDPLNLKAYREIGKGYKGILPSQIYLNQIPEKFEVTMKEWKKSRGVSGPPSYKPNQLENINIPIYFNNGKTIDSSNDFNCARMGINYTGDKLKTDSEYLINGKFVFGKANERLDLHIAYHRFLPEKAIIKKTSLVGKFNKPFGWKWQIQFSIEYPDISGARNIPTLAAGFDPSWSVCGEYLHLGTFSLSNGQVLELRLPFKFANKATIRGHKYFLESQNHTRLIKDILELKEKQSLEDSLKDEAKKVLETIKSKKIEEVLDYPPECIRMLTGLSRMGHGGLNKFKKLLVAADVKDDIRKALDNYYENYIKSRRQIRGNQLKFSAFRDDLYKKIAKWCSDSFYKLGWEDTNLKKLQEYDGDNKQLQESKKYKNLASHNDLKSKVKSTMNREGLEFVDINPYKTSQTCSVCGGRIQKTHKQLVVCENGHNIDRDANASTNMLNALAVSASASELEVKIPAHLRRYLHALPLTVENKQHVMHAVQSFG